MCICSLLLDYLATTEPWLQPKTKKSKKRKLSPSGKKKKKKNYSIKPPPTSSKRGKTKTGFNSKSLKFEPGMNILCLSSKMLSLLHFLLIRCLFQ